MHPRHRQILQKLADKKQRASVALDAALNRWYPPGTPVIVTVGRGEMHGWIVGFAFNGCLGVKARNGTKPRHNKYWKDVRHG